MCLSTFPSFPSFCSFLSSKESFSLPPPLPLAKTAQKKRNFQLTELEKLERQENANKLGVFTLSLVFKKQVNKQEGDDK